MLHQTRQNPAPSEHNNPRQNIQRENPVAVIQGNSHGVSTADVFAGGLDDRLAGLIERSVDAVVSSGVCFLDQSLELRMDATTASIQLSLLESQTAAQTPNNSDHIRTQKV